MSFKKICLYVLLLVISTCILSACSETDSNTFQNSENSKYISLNEDTELLLINSEDSPILTMSIGFRIGSFAQDIDTAGLYHIIEHMLIKEVEEDLLEIGADYNANTYYDYLKVYFSFFEDDLDSGINILNKLLSIETFDEEKLSMEKNVIAHEIYEHQLQKDTEIWKEIKKVYTDNAAYLMDVIGNEEQINTFTLELINDIYRKNILNSAKLIIVAGNVESDYIADKIKVVDNTDGSILPEKKNFNFIIKDKVEIDMNEESGNDHSNLWLVWVGPGIINNRQDSITADLFCKIINHPESAYYKKLMNSGIKKYTITYFSQAYSGPIVFRAEYEKGIDNIVSTVINTLINFEFNDKKIVKKAGAELINELNSYQQKDQNKLDIITKTWAVSGDINYYYEYQEYLEKGQQKDLERFAEEYINQNYIKVQY